METGTTEIAGIVIHSDAPLFLGAVGLHLLAGLVAVTAGFVTMLSPKRRGRHSQSGNVYFWAIVAVFSTVTILVILRGPQDWHLLALGAAAFSLAWIGRAARRGHWRNSLSLHLTAMGLSYVVLLTAFYVETGNQLPVWKEFPQFFYWIVPTAIGLPFILHALIWHPLVRQKKE